jgi:CheY-like chemotaxis protein
MKNKTIKILAIDASKDNLVVLEALLKEGFPDARYITGDSGKMGFELCQTEIPDVILLDLVMPGMDSLEVCAKLEAQITAMLRIKESEDNVHNEKVILEELVNQRTNELTEELTERKRAEKKLIQSLDKIIRNRQAIMNLMED